MSGANMSEYTINHRPRRLREGDKVTFEVGGVTYRYEVEGGRYLNRLDHPNDAVFKALGVDAEGVSREAYGYNPDLSGSWPVSKPRDFAALCRLVNALYDEIARQASPKQQAASGTATPQVSSSRPKVGDRVIIVPGEDLTETHIGMKGRLLRDDRDGCPFRVQLDVGLDGYFAEDEVQAIPEEESSKPPSLVSLGFDWFPSMPDRIGEMSQYRFETREEATQYAQKNCTSGTFFVAEIFAGSIKRFTTKLVEEDV